MYGVFPAGGWPSHWASVPVLFTCTMKIDLTGRSAIVTGASRGIGLAVTCAVAGNGAHVIARARRSSAELGKLATEGSVTIPNVDLEAAQLRGCEPATPL
jgi:NAD(P)-dependent dehydrogenase (short-subunit alcohol dehydrogenase family)